MEASGYERDWVKALCCAGIEVRIVDPKRVRSLAEKPMAQLICGSFGKAAWIGSSARRQV